MDLGTCRSRARFYLNEPKAAQFSDANLNAIIVESNREIYAWIVSRAPDLFVRDDRFTWTANTVNIVLDTKVAADGAAIGRWLKVLSMFMLRDNAVLSSNNPVKRMERRDSVWELYDTASTASAVTTFDGVFPYGGLRFAIVGRSMWLYPIPTVDVFLWTHMIPVVFDPSLDTHNLLSIDGGTTGEYTEHHDLIAMLAALKAMANTRDDGGGVLGTLYAARRQATADLFGTLQAMMEPRKVNPHAR